MGATSCSCGHRASEQGSTQVGAVASPVFDFSHLSPEERILLAEDPRDGLPERRVQLSEAQRAELERRRDLHVADPAPGRPWRDLLDEIERRAL